MSNLYRLTVKKENHSYWDKNKTYYLVNDTKEEAIDRMNNHIKSGYKVSSIALLGSDYSWGRTFFGKD